MAVPRTKLRTLYIMKILQERTDEEHMLNASEIGRILKQNWDIETDRRTIYSEIELLKTFGMDIIQVRGKTPGYYVGTRQFELPELKLLVDAVQASRFITEKKSKELIGKLEKLCSEAEAVQLSRQVTITNRPKSSNETIYYNVDKIHSAIYRNRQISFRYAAWTPDKKMRLKKDGKPYIVSPWSLTWDDENYYLIAYDPAADIIKHYRVDKMQRMDILDSEREGKETFSQFDIADFAKKTFGMYGGEDQEVQLRCRNDMAGVVLDRFGYDTRMRPDGPEHFIAHVDVTVSRQFFGWLTGVGSHLIIEGPENVRDEYRKYLEEIVGHYE